MTDTVPPHVLAATAQRYIAAMASNLARRSSDDTALAPFAEHLARATPAGAIRGPKPRLKIPAMGYLAKATNRATTDDDLLPAALDAAATLDWSLTYAGGGMDPVLANGLMSCQALGTYGCFASEEVATGLFLIAPGVTYPLHTHAAPEIYHVISGTLEVQHGVGATPTQVGPGEVSVTPPGRVHALRSLEEPVLICYVWIRDLYSTIWCWEEKEPGTWTRSSWHRPPGKSWTIERTEPLTRADWAAAHS